MLSRNELEQIFVRDGLVHPQQAIAGGLRQCPGDDIERRVNQLTIPLSFAEELYDLRSHINFVRKRLGWLMQTSESSAALSEA